MHGSLLLYVGAGSVCLAILLLVTGLVSSGARADGVAGGLAAIERNYGQARARGGARRKRPAAQLELPAWSRALALRLSPSSVSASLQGRLDLAGNPPAWTPDRMLAAKGTANPPANRTCTASGAGHIPAAQAPAPSIFWSIWACVTTSTAPKPGSVTRHRPSIRRI